MEGKAHSHYNDEAVGMTNILVDYEIGYTHCVVSLSCANFCVAKNSYAGANWTLEVPSQPDSFENQFIVIFCTNTILKRSSILEPNIELFEIVQYNF